MIIRRMATIDPPQDHSFHDPGSIEFPTLNIDDPRLLWALRPNEVLCADDILHFARLVMGEYYDYLNCSIPAHVCFASARDPILWPTPGVDSYTIVGGEALRVLVRPPKTEADVYDPNRLRGVVGGLEMSDIDILATSHQEVGRIITAMSAHNNIPDNTNTDTGWTCALTSPSVIQCVYAQPLNGTGARCKDVQIIRGRKNQTVEEFVSTFDFAHNMVWIAPHEGVPQINLTLQGLIAMTMHPKLVVGAGVGTTHTRFSRRMKARLKGWDVPDIKSLDLETIRKMRFAGMPKCFSRDEAMHRMCAHYTLTSAQFVTGQLVPNMIPMSISCGVYYENVSSNFITHPMIKVGNDGVLLRSRHAVMPHITMHRPLRQSRIRTKRREIPWARFSLSDTKENQIASGFEDTIFLSGRMPRCAMRVEVVGGIGVDGDRAQLTLSTCNQASTRSFVLLREEVIDIFRRKLHSCGAYNTGSEKELASIWRYTRNETNSTLRVIAFCDNDTLYYDQFGHTHNEQRPSHGIDTRIERTTYMVALRPFAIRSRQTHISFYVMSMQSTPCPRSTHPNTHSLH